MEEMGVVMKKFGDEESTLMDQFERLSFEIQLNQAILGRSLSESSGAVWSQAPQPPAVRQARRGSLGFQKVMKRLLKPILSRKGGGGTTKGIPTPKGPRFLKAFSRSVRV